MVFTRIDLKWVRIFEEVVRAILIQCTERHGPVCSRCGAVGVRWASQRSNRTESRCLVPMPVRRLAVVAGAATCTGLNTGCRANCVASITPRPPHAPPGSAKTSMQQTPVHPSPETLVRTRRRRVRFRGAFAWVADSHTVSLTGLRCGGSAACWGFAIYLASKDGYEDAILPTGDLAGTHEDAPDTACGPTSETPPAGPEPPTNVRGEHQLAT